MEIKGLKFVQTCGACPEQYDVYKGDEIVGYVRLRHSFLRCDYPCCGGETIYEKCYNEDDLGGFLNDFERMRQLNIIAKKINKRIEDDKKNLEDN